MISPVLRRANKNLEENSPRLFLNETEDPDRDSYLEKVPVFMIETAQNQPEGRHVIRRLFSDQADNLSVQFARYTIVGGMAFVIDFGSLYILTELFSLHYLISAAIAFLIGLMTNYVISITWVFSKSILNNKAVEFGIFAFIGVMGLVFNELFMWLCTEYGHLHYLMSKIISAIFVFLWNFSSRKFILFD